MGVSRGARVDLDDLQAAAHALAVAIGSADALSAAPVRDVENRPSGARAHDVAVASGDPYADEESCRSRADPNDRGDSGGNGAPIAYGSIYSIMITPLTGRGLPGSPAEPIAYPARCSIGSAVHDNGHSAICEGGAGMPNSRWPYGARRVAIGKASTAIHRREPVPRDSRAIRRNQP